MSAEVEFEKYWDKVKPKNSEDVHVFKKLQANCAFVAGFNAGKNENSSLLPCPFCGGKASWLSGLDIHIITCHQCEVRMGHINTTKDEAFEAWNRRTTNELSQ